MVYQQRNKFSNAKSSFHSLAIVQLVQGNLRHVFGVSVTGLPKGLDPPDGFEKSGFYAVARNFNGGVFLEVATL